MGLFGLINGSGAVADISVINADISGDWQVGGLVSTWAGSAYVQNSYTTGKVQAPGGAGTSIEIGGLIVPQSPNYVQHLLEP